MVMQFDVVVCFSLTKWVHLQHGDDGVLCLFQRLAALCRPGGSLLLEVQPWSSYAKRAKMSPLYRRNYAAIKVRPPQFPLLLCSRAVGFERCDTLVAPRERATKGFEARPIYRLHKPTTAATAYDDDVDDVDDGTNVAT